VKVSIGLLSVAPFWFAKVTYVGMTMIVLLWVLLMMRRRVVVFYSVVVVWYLKVSRVSKQKVGINMGTSSCWISIEIPLEWKLFFEKAIG
jgi:hypothetical protein